MRSAKGEARRDRKSGLGLVTLHRQDSRDLGDVLASARLVVAELLRDSTFESARAAAAFLGCSRRTARRARTYARRIFDVEVRP